MRRAPIYLLSDSSLYSDEAIKKDLWSTLLDAESFFRGCMLNAYQLELVQVFVSDNDPDNLSVDEILTVFDELTPEGYKLVEFEYHPIN